MAPRAQSSAVRSGSVVWTETRRHCWEFEVAQIVRIDIKDMDVAESSCL